MFRTVQTNLVLKTMLIHLNLQIILERILLSHFMTKKMMRLSVRKRWSSYNHWVKLVRWNQVSWMKLKNFLSIKIWSIRICLITTAICRYTTSRNSKLLLTIKVELLNMKRNYCWWVNKWRRKRTNMLS